MLTDLSEQSGTCLVPGVSFDVDSKGVTATVANPNPYTGTLPICSLAIAADSAGFTVFLDLSFTALTFTAAAPVADQAPTAFLAGTATGAILQDDGTGTGGLVQTDSCSYSGTGDRYHRMSK